MAERITVTVYRIDPVARPTHSGRSKCPLDREVIGERIRDRSRVHGVEKAAAPGREQQMVVLGEIVDAAEVEAPRAIAADHAGGLMKDLAAKREAIGKLALE